MKAISCIATVFGFSEDIAKSFLETYKKQITFYGKDILYYDLFKEMELIEDSYDKCIFTSKADDLFEDALTLFIQENDLKITTVGIKKPRALTSEMEDFKDYTLELASQFFEIKDVKVDRSNYLVRLKKRTKGVRQFECMNNGNFRIFAYNIPEHVQRALVRIGMVYKKGASGNAFFDIKCTTENIKSIITLLSEV